MRFSIMSERGHDTIDVDTRTEDGAKLAQQMLDQLVAEHRTLGIRVHERSEGSLVRALGGGGSDGGYRVLRPGKGGGVDVGSLDPDSEVLGALQLKGG